MNSCKRSGEYLRNRRQRKRHGTSWRTVALICLVWIGSWGASAAHCAEPADDPLVAKLRTGGTVQIRRDEGGKVVSCYVEKEALTKDKIAVIAGMTELQGLGFHECELTAIWG